MGGEGLEPPTASLEVSFPFQRKKSKDDLNADSGTRFHLFHTLEGADRRSRVNLSRPCVLSYVLRSFDIRLLVIFYRNNYKRS